MVLLTCLPSFQLSVQEDRVKGVDYGCYLVDRCEVLCILELECFDPAIKCSSGRLYVAQKCLGKQKALSLLRSLATAKLPERKGRRGGIQECQDAPAARKLRSEHLSTRCATEFKNFSSTTHTCSNPLSVAGLY